jgi:hypothetical protein
VFRTMRLLDMGVDELAEHYERDTGANES